MERPLKSTIKKLKLLKSDSNNFWPIKIKNSPTLIAANFHIWFLNLTKRHLNNHNQQFNFIPL